MSGHQRRQSSVVVIAIAGFFVLIALMSVIVIGSASSDINDEAQNKSPVQYCMPTGIVGNSHISFVPGLGPVQPNTACIPIENSD